MSTTAEVPQSIANSNLSRDRVLLIGIALTSFAALLLELALTRLFSVVLFYHFAFLAISIALLGLGAGGVFAHLWKARLSTYSTRRITTISSALAAIVVTAVLEIVLHVPVMLNLSIGNLLRLSGVYVCAAVPFFLTGVQFSTIFARESSRIPRIYGADLIGGSLACLAVVPLLDWLGGPNTILFAGVASAIAAVVWSSRTKGRRLALALVAVLLLLTALNFSGRIADVLWAKGIR